MSEFEMFIELPEGDGLLLSKYGDRYSLVRARSGGAVGTVSMKWCYPQGKDRKPIDKAIPWGCDLGTRMDAIQVLRRALNALTQVTD